MLSIKSNNKNNVQELEQLRSSAEQACNGADRALVEARAAYEAALGDGRDAAIKARQRCVTAEVDLDVARRSVEDLNRQIASAHEASKLSEIERTRLEAERLRSLFENTARQGLARMSVDARAILRAWCEAEIAIENARQAEGRGASIASAEGFRSLPKENDKEVKRERSVRLVHPHTGKPYSPEHEQRVRRETSVERLPQSAAFDTITYQKGKPGINMPLLAASLSVPAIAGGEKPGWSPMEYAGPHEVLKRLEELERALQPKALDYVIVEELVEQNISFKR